MNDNMTMIQIAGNRGEGKYLIVDDSDASLFDDRKVHLSTNGYCVSYIKRDGKRLIEYAHRMIMQPNKGIVVDHINGNKLDCRRENLRFCTRGQNTLNSKNRNSNLPKGVMQSSYSSSRFHARIVVKGKGIRLGTYDTAQEAANAYDSAALQYFGEYARTNHMIELQGV